MSGARCLTVATTAAVFTAAGRLAADLFVPLPTQTAPAWWFTPAVAVVASLATSTIWWMASRTGRLEAGGRR